MFQEAPHKVLKALVECIKKNQVVYIEYDCAQKWKVFQVVISLDPHGIVVQLWFPVGSSMVKAYL